MEKTLEILMPDVKIHGENISYISHDYLQPSYANRDTPLNTNVVTPLTVISSFQHNETTVVWLTEVATGANETEYKVAEVIWRVCPVFLFIFGTVGNTLILLMLRTLRLGRTSMHIYLRALAISDLCVLYTGLLRWWIFWSFGVDLRDQHIIICKVHTWMVYVSLYVSAWLLVFMTLERTCSACVPHRVNTFCTKRRACCLIVFIVVFQSVMQSHFLFGMSLGKYQAEGPTICWALSSEYNFFVHNIYPFVDLVLLSLIPFMCVILGNIVIIWKTFLSIKTAAELNLTSDKGANLRRQRASSMTVILVCLSTLFLLTTSPTCVYNMWERGENAQAAMKTSVGVAQTELAWASVNIIMYCNNTFNFYLYCLSGRKFRNEIMRQFSRRRTDSHSVMLSAPSLQLHRCPQNEQKYCRNRENSFRLSINKENSNGFPKNKENSHGFSKSGENDNGISTVIENSNCFQSSVEISSGFHSGSKNSQCFLLFPTPYLARKPGAYL